MKKRLLIIVINTFLFLLFFACSTPKNVPFERTGAVTFMGVEESGTIILESEGVGVNLDQAIAHAERNAIENLLFKGIPGSTQRQPLVPKEYEALKS